MAPFGSFKWTNTIFVKRYRYKILNYTYITLIWRLSFVIIGHRIISRDRGKASFRVQIIQFIIHTEMNITNNINSMDCSYYYSGKYRLKFGRWDKLSFRCLNCFSYVRIFVFLFRESRFDLLRYRHYFCNV